MRVSVVVCTYNRADSLGATLQCLRHQTFDDFEVVVVNGPSTDHTMAVLTPWRDDIKLVQNEHRNLSISRNLGICASAGDVVAFIDDDALPEADWLLQAMARFDDHEVAGVGGIVFDHTGLSLQWPYSAIDRFGWVKTRADRPYDDQCFPGSFEFPYLQGTNALFRRDRLHEIGGFDDTFDFYLDETDVCCRLIDAGWLLRQLHNAPVHHKYLPSAVRDHQRITTNWSSVVKNHTYFLYRHSLPMFSESELLEQVRGFIDTRIADTKFHADAGRLPPEAVREATATCLSAFAEGQRLGRQGVSRRLAPLADDPPPFLPFRTIGRGDGRKVTFVSSGYAPNLTGGIARLMSDLAPALARRGHDVRIITRATTHEGVDFEDGVWVHRIGLSGDHTSGGDVPEAPRHVDAFATAVREEAERIMRWTHHDVVFGPAWDVEVLGLLRQTSLPVAVHIATPVAVAADMAGFLDAESDSTGPKLMMELESEVMATADLFQANTLAVLETVRELYHEPCESPRWQIANLGLTDRRDAGRRSAAVGRRNDGAQVRSVLYVGRFETRKGIDNVLHAMERVLPDYSDVHLTLVGEDRPLSPGEPLFGAHWMRTHREESWIDRVHMVGVVDDDELHQHYARADVVVLPSRYESFGLAMAEAMMHGRALVSASAGGIPEVVRDGLDGVLVPPGETAAVESAIRLLLDDPGRAAELGRSARRRYEDVFSIQPFAERFEAVFGSLTTAERAIADIAPGNVLARGRRALFACPDDAVVTVHVRPLEDASVTIGDSARMLILTADRVHRLRLDGLETPVAIECISGSLRFEGATVVAGV